MHTVTQIWQFKVHTVTQPDFNAILKTSPQCIYLYLISTVRYIKKLFFFVFFVFLIYNMFILFSCSIFKQVISYIIEGNLIYVYIYIYIPVLYIFALLPSVFQFSSISIILILKYINMILLFIFPFCLYSYFFCMYSFLNII